MAPSLTPKRTFTEASLGLGDHSPTLTIHVKVLLLLPEKQKAIDTEAEAQVKPRRGQERDVWWAAEPGAFT